MIFRPDDAPLLLVFGQSNAHGHAVPLPENERFASPMTHVLGLPRDPNQAFSPAPLVWRGYTSEDTNLGETQDHTVCVPTEFARLWQAACEAGASLPTLRVVRLSIGAEGVSSNYMWNPDYPRGIVPGALGTCKISLFPLSVDVLSRVRADLEAQGLRPVVLGLHWIGGENETSKNLRALEDLEDIYDTLLRGWRDALRCDIPVTLYRLCCPVRIVELGCSVAGMDRVNEAFGNLCRRPGVTQVCAADAPHFDASIERTQGIFMPDAVHYTAATHRWFARRAFDALDLL